MKLKTIYILILLSFVFTNTMFSSTNYKENNSQMTSENDSLLRHVVLFKFKVDATSEKIKEIENAFKELTFKIPEIYSYEWGLNNSPENLNKGFTHCFFLTFKSESDRAIYLPHPDHKLFGALLTPYLDDVLVLDYWSY